MQRQTRLASLLALAALPLCALVGASAHPIVAHGGTTLASGAIAIAQPPVLLFVLDDDSAYIYGCFPADPFPCAGPTVYNPNFTGQFAASFTGVDDEGFSVYELSGVDLVADFGDNTVHVEGSGVYRRTFGSRAQQELVLAALLDGAPAAFDSGVVPVPPDSIHFMDVSVNMNDLQNYDVVLNIVAGPGRAAPSAPSIGLLLP
jgi:hypothetical protein